VSPGHETRSTYEEGVTRARRTLASMMEAFFIMEPTSMPVSMR